MRPRAPHLLAAFALTVMADPISSVTYAIEAALGQLDGGLASLVPTMALVVATIALVSVTYAQLVRRFPNGGGGAQALAEAFGEGWAFVPLGALLVDFTLTIAVSCAAGASALVAWAPGLASARVAIAIVLAGLVALGCLYGHRGRIGFAAAAALFLGLAAVVIVRGALAPGEPGSPSAIGDASLGAALLAMPLGMALATGVEAPSNAIAQLGELDDAGRRRYGLVTIWSMVAIVGTLTLAFALLAVRLGERAPRPDSTLLADVARHATGGDALFGLFQAGSALLLLAAAASSFLAGSGLLEALARHGGNGRVGLLPRRFAQTNRRFAPPWGIAVLLGLAIALLAASGGHDTELVQFYAVAVFASFLAALVAAAALNRRERRPVALACNVAGIVPVAFVLALNVGRIVPLASLGAAALVALLLWRRWVAAGRPGGIARALR
jgi:amino acid transporter